MKHLTILILCLCVFYQQIASESMGPIESFIQTNLVGFPVIHETRPWIFDPDISLRRRKQFIELHGDKGEKLIERLGLGIDGYADERLKLQRQRDEGHLGGLNSLRP
ncbi:unnamed protein product, partial [Brenthis ino]